MAPILTGVKVHDLEAIPGEIWLSPLLFGKGRPQEIQHWDPIFKTRTELGEQFELYKEILKENIVHAHNPIAYEIINRKELLIFRTPLKTKQSLVAADIKWDAILLELCYLKNFKKFKFTLRFYFVKLFYLKQSFRFIDVSFVNNSRWSKIIVPWPSLTTEDGYKPDSYSLNIAYLGEQYGGVFMVDGFRLKREDSDKRDRGTYPHCRSWGNTYTFESVEPFHTIDKDFLCQTGYIPTHVYTPSDHQITYRKV